MSAIPERYRGRDVGELALLMLADVIDPPPAEAAADPERWRQAVSKARASLGLPSPAVEAGAPRGGRGLDRGGVGVLRRGPRVRGYLAGRWHGAAPTSPRRARG
jgi:hypothetical protein